MNTIFSKKALTVALASGIMMASSVSHAANNKKEVDDAIYSDPEMAKLIMELGQQQVDKGSIENRIREKMREVENEKILRKAIPYSPEEIADMKEKTSDVRRATKRSPYGVPEHTMRVEYLNIEDGTPIHVKVAPGFMSSLVFADSLGNPWPVSKVVNANETAFSVEDDSNILTIFMKEQEGVGNIGIRLEGMTTPIVVILETDYKEVDGRLEVKLNQMFPGAELNSNMLDYDMFSSGSRHDSTALRILNMDIPKGTLIRRIEGLPNAFAYEVGEYYYITMSERMIGPEWGYGSITPAGKRIYRISNTFSRIQVNINGKREWYNIGNIVDVNHTRHSTNN